ncbi:MAG TPA: hypothetical protein VH475_13670 [Tepidisphaeraceae bacterium]|jgi:hypothetical protein
MFKLFRLAIYALVGYAAYQFVLDVLESSRQQPQTAGGQGQSRGRGGGGGTRASGEARMTAARRGGAAGKGEETTDADGASTRHRVGRGVV